MRVLFICLDMKSHVLRMKLLADSIKSECDVHFGYGELRPPSDSINNIASHHYHPISWRVPVSSAKSLDHSWLSRDSLRPYLDSTTDLINKVKPDLVVDDYTFVGSIATDLCRVKKIAIMNGLFSPYLNLLRPIPAVHSMKIYEDFIPDFIKNYFQKWTYSQIQQGFRELRSDLGLKQRESYFHEFEGDYNLLCEHGPFAPQKKLPENYYYLGPLFNYNSSKISDSLKKKINPEKKTILVSMGSTGSFEVLKLLSDVCFEEFNIIVIDGQITEEATKCADNFIFEPFQPLDNLFELVDLVISQAGTGNIFQALYHGVPLLCFPSFFEQEWNADRIEKLGLGRSLKHDISISDFRDIVSEWANKKCHATFQEHREHCNPLDTIQRFFSYIKSLHGGTKRRNE